MTPFERAMVGELEGSHGDRVHVGDVHGATALHHYAGLNYGASRRHQRAARDRHVTVTPVNHGMASLNARLPARDAVLVRKRLSLEAERLRAQGDHRGHHAIMADCLVDTLLGREDAMDPTMLDIGMIITDRALIDPGAGDIAQIEGYGPVPGDCE